MKFDLPHDNASIIKVIGVGGGGSNAVNHMYKQGIKGVDFIVCNTDQQALDISPVPLKIVLGVSLTKGRGAGSLPEVGKNAAIENIEEVKAILANNTEMVFITAGLGGGTGTGAAPIIAKAAKEMGILTVGIVTIPFGFEGKKRKLQADAGLDALKQNVDTLLVISNDKLREIYGNLKVTEAFGHADDILATAAKGIADIITTTLQINTDINDVKTVMKDSGVAIMGSASAEGESRAIRAVEQAMSSPLLNDSNIKGARYVLVNVTCGEDEITMDELGEITDYIQDEAGMTAEVIKGYGVDMSLGGKVNVTIIATGFNSKADVGIQIERAPEKRVFSLMDEPKMPEPAPVVNVAPATNKVEEMTSYIKEETNFIKEETKKEETTVQQAEDIVAETPAEPFVYTKEETVKTEQTTFEFEITNITNSTANAEEPFLIANAAEEKVIPQAQDENTIISKVQTDEQLKKAQDRVAKLKELSFKLKSPNGLSELENEPAYKRRNINLDQTPHSSESQVSRYTLSENDDKKVEIKPNNSFLHDNVD
ncbi:MAG TPA: cell division protein FtsZ [Bacteroidia bacterium]|nr:cell division protein FtsZ [Bacteroidia bacterium]HRG53563.1 cell division protein FtsZ [Bacteroidia bacterium]